MKKNDHNAASELKDIAPLLASSQIITPYTVSTDYFEALPLQVQALIESGYEPLFFSNKENPYSVPGDYFENLAAEILKKVNLASGNQVFEELEQISPILNKINKKPVNTVPQGYWEQLSGKLIQVEENTPKAKVVSINRVKKVYNFVAAAVVIGIIAIGMFLFVNKKDVSVASDNKSTVGVKKLSEQEIIEFLQTTSPAESVVLTNNSLTAKDNDIKASVSKISDKEIKQFLEENGVTVEM